MVGKYFTKNMSGDDEYGGGMKLELHELVTFDIENESQVVARNQVFSFIFQKNKHGSKLRSYQGSTMNFEDMLMSEYL
jgi:hypothetical protein